MTWSEYGEIVKTAAMGFKALGIIFKDTKQLTQPPEIKVLIENEIKAKNKDLARFETIKKFVILPEEFDQDEGEVTATQKVKRKAVTEKFKDQLEALYSEN
ncbi:hypothetical protein ACFL9T_16135 [Thermodesulfobacteriota bacterium]